MQRTIQRALISVFHKEGLAPIVEKLHAHGVEILSTGGTQKAIEALGAKVTPVAANQLERALPSWRTSTERDRPISATKARRKA